MGLIFQNIKKKNNPETAMIQIEKKFIMYSYYSFSKADDSRFPRERGYIFYRKLPYPLIMNRS